MRTFRPEPDSKYQQTYPSQITSQSKKLLETFLINSDPKESFLALHLL